MTSLIKISAAALCMAGLAAAQSPAMTETIDVKGGKLTIGYSSPRVNGREGKLFGAGGRISKDPNFPIWRAGANSATKLHTDASLKIGAVAIAPGDYTLYVDLTDPAQWQLVINKQTGQWGLSYDKAQDVGRVKMTMSKAPAMVENLKYTLANAGGKVQLTLAWEDVSASVTITVAP